MTEQNDVVFGNVYDKYGTTNPIAKYLMSGFLGSVRTLFDEVSPREVLEVGCGEGKLAAHLVAGARQRPTRFVATDLRVAVDTARLDPLIEVRAASVYELPYGDREFDLVVCCEVLEHLEEPERALREVRRVTRGEVIISTPREPLWRAMNVARGKYLRDLGNTPGHIQHFSRASLIRAVERHFRVERVLTPIPWTVLRAIPR